MVTSDFLRSYHLNLLEKLYRQITIPPRVLEELKLSSEKPGAKIILAATNAGWLKVSRLKKKDDHSILNLLVDAGEAESIQLALEKNSDILIIDDRRGRKIEKSRNIRIIGTGGILIAAKRKGILNKVAPILDNLAGVGYRLAPDLCRRILELAVELHFTLFCSVYPAV